MKGDNTWYYGCLREDSATKTPGCMESVERCYAGEKDQVVVHSCQLKSSRDTSKQEGYTEGHDDTLPFNKDDQEMEH
jgi:hypothetical protein